MRPNQFKNQKESIPEDLSSFLRLINNAGIKLELFAMGGTAMILKNLKAITKYIDFLTTADYKTIKEAFTKVGLIEKSSNLICNVWYLNDIRIDIFYGDLIIGVQLSDDWLKESEFIKEIGNIKLYILNWYDIIITKLARSEKRDIEDILLIMKYKKIKLESLKNKYYEIAEVSLMADYKLKFIHLEREYFKNETKRT